MSDTPSTISRRNLLTTAGLAGAGLASMAAAPAVTGGLAHTATNTAGEVIGDTLDALRLVKVFASTDEQYLLGDFDDTHVIHDDGGLEFLLWPGDLARLRATGLRFELLETPMERELSESLRLRREQSAVGRTISAPGQTDTGDYRHLGDFNADMRALAEAYPDTCKLIELPFRTLDRRVVLGLEICDDVDNHDGRPVFYNDGCHHAREWPAAEVPIMWAYDLLEADAPDADLGTDPAVAAARKERLLTIRKHVRNVIVPIVNPDGYDWSREFPVGTGGADLGTGTIGTFFGNGAEAIPAGGRGRYWRKNRRQYFGSNFGVANPTTIQPDQVTPEELGLGDGNPLPDQYGIDPNRNYAFGWGGDGSSSVTDSATYRGSQPFSEQESKNVQHVFEKYMCLGSISHHTSGDLILWAWGDTFDDAPDNDLLEGIGRAMAEYNGYRPQKSIQLYVTTGTASDYMYGSRASISYTFEHAGSAFHPEYTSTVPAMYDRNRDALMFLAEQTCLVPALRPDYSNPAVLTPAARDQMLMQGVPLDQLNHAILRGNAGTQATVKVTKRYSTQLWVQDYAEGNTGAENPLGQPDVEERQECEFQTAPDGSFELHVAPSTQPKVEFEGGTEAYDISVLPDDGSAGFSVRRVVRRGEVIDL